MSINQEIADRLARIAGLQELLGFDKFRAISNERAARVIEGHPADMSSLDRPALLAIDGIGPKLADKVIEFVKTGAIRELDELTSQVPPGLLPLLEVSGLGPKTVRMFWQEAGVTDLASLHKIIDNGSILKLPRMGEKAVQKLRDSLAIVVSGDKRLPLGRALPVAESFVEQLRSALSIERITYAGSLRRGKETIGDIDILVAPPRPKCTPSPVSAPDVAQTFRSLPQVRHVLASGETRSSVRAALTSQARIVTDPESPAAPSPTNEPTVQVDLKVVPPESWGAALMYFTGSKEHNVRLRERALKLGFTLNEYGLFPDDADPEPPHKRGIKPVAGATEEEVYRALGLYWIPPELREDRGELDRFALPSSPPHRQLPHLAAPARSTPAATTKKKSSTPKPSTTSTSPASPSGSAEAPPRLIEVLDIKAELHAHTTASDGVMSIIELSLAAKRRGFHTIAVTDHSKSSAIAGGLSPERLREHVRAIHAAREQVPGITILAGSEVDILADGSLDYDDELLGLLDTIVASPHTALSQDPAAATKRLLRAVTHPLVRVLGHPTGRLINKRPGLSPDFGEIFAAAREHRVALELNAHWMRLDLRDAHVRGAIDAGCVIAIDCDVHEPSDFDNLRFGITTARRGGAQPGHCINTWDALTLHKWLRRG